MTSAIPIAVFAPRPAAVLEDYLRLNQAAVRMHASPLLPQGSPAAQLTPGRLAGRLVACAGMGSRGAEISLATTLSGGASIAIEPRAPRVKDALRAGCCDFMVNSLDEALRILKNELRKRQPVAVGLLGNAAEVLDEMAARGVLPEILVDTTPASAAGYFATPGNSAEETRALQSEATRRLFGMGALAVEASHGLPPATPPVCIDRSQPPIPADPAHALLVQWSVEPASPADLRLLDAIAADILPPGDAVRRRWLEQAPGAFRRQRPPQRLLPMTPAEWDGFRSAAADASATGRLQGVVTSSPL